MKGDSLRQKIKLSVKRFTDIADCLGISPQALNKNLSDIMPGLTAYWARHSWATIAASLDIQEDTIALALGHSSAHTTTAIYIQRDLRKVDAANRRVIDFVLNKKPDAK